MYWTDVAGVFVALFVGLLQCGLIAWGISKMDKNNENREASNAALLGMGVALQSQSAVLADIGAGIREILQRSQPVR